MKTRITLLMSLPLVLLLACKNDVAPPVYDYHAHVYKPDGSTRHLGDTLQLDIEFESHTGETVHQINVRIFNAVTFAELYNKPIDSHINETSGDYEFMDTVVLSAANGFSEGDWVLQAKVWGQADGEGEEVSTVNFHIAN